MSDMTVRQIVDQIYENMSNAIPELVLMLIALQEKNAVPPKNLPVQIGVVAQAADVLAQVADGLANDEYADFPDIQKDILDASDHVKKASVDIRGAANELVGNADRRAAYGNIMESTKMIGSCCIKLLAIVYGAFFKRAMGLAASTKKASEDIDPYTAGEDPQAFADAVSDACSRAGELAARIRELAENEESPLRRREMMEAADEIDRRSDALIEQCNEYLADLDNEEKRKAFIDELAAFNAAIDQQMKPVEVMKNEYEEQQAGHAREEEERAVAEAAAAEAAAAEAEALAAAEAALAVEIPPPSAKLTPIDVSQRHLTQEEFVEECYRQKDGYRDFVAAAEQGDAEESAACARALVERQRVLDAEATEMAAVWEDERKTDDAKKARREIEKGMPQVLIAAKAVLQDTENDQKRELLEKKFRDVDTALDAYQCLVEPPPKKTEEELAAEAAAAEMQAAIAARVARAAAAADAEEATVVMGGAGKVASRYDAREGVPEAADADEHNEPHVALMATAREAEEIMNALQAAAVREDQAEMVQAASDLEAISPYLINDMKRAAAGIRDKAHREEVQEKIRAYEEEILPRLQRAIDRVLANPDDEEAQAELAEAIRAARTAIDEIAALTNADALAEVEKAKRANATLCELAQQKDCDPCKFADAAAETAAHTQNVIDELRSRAARCEDPAKAARLNALADELETALAEMMEAARKARENPSAENIAALKAASARLDQALDASEAALNPEDAAVIAMAVAAKEREMARNVPAHVKKASKYDKREAVEAVAAADKEGQPHVALVANAQEVNDVLSAIQNAAARRDKAELLQAVSDLDALNPHLVDDMKRAAAGIRDPARREEVQEKIRAYEEEIIPRLQRAVDRVLANPDDEEAQAELAEAIRAARTAIDEIAALTNADALAEVEKAKRANATLCELAQQKDCDPCKFADAAAETAAHTQNVIDELRSRAARCEDPAKAARLNALADELETALAEMMEAARKARENPSAENIAALKAASAKLDKALDASEAALNPEDASKQGAALRRLDAQAVALQDATLVMASARRDMLMCAQLVEKDPEAYKKRMNEVAAKMEKAADAIRLSDEEQVAYDALRLADKYQELANAGCDGDKTGVQACAQLIADDREKLIEHARTLAATTQDAAVEQALTVAIAQLEELGDRPEQAAKAAIADRRRGAQAQAEAQTAQTILRAIADAANPRPIEAIAREEEKFAAAHEALRRAVEAGDAQAAHAAALEMQRASEAIAASAQHVAAHRTNTGLTPEEAKAVQVQARKLRADAAEAVRAAEQWKADAANVEAQQVMMARAEAAAQDIAELDSLMKVQPHYIAAKEREDLARMQNAVIAHRNAPETFEAAKLVVADQKALREAVEAAAAAKKVTPEDKRKMDAALGFIDKTIPAIVADSKVALTSPSAAQDAKVAQEIYEVQTAVMAIDAGMDAHTPLGDAKRAIVDARKAVTRAERAALAKNKREQEAATTDMKRALDMLKKLREDQKSALNAPGVDTEAVAKSLKEIDALTKDLEKLTKDRAHDNSTEVHAVALRMKAPLASLEEAVCVPRSEAAATKKKVAGISARARKAAASGKRTDLSGLLSAAQSLLDSLRGFEDASRDAAMAGANTERSKAALALDALLRGLEAGSIEATPETTKKIAKLMAQAAPIKQAAAVPEKQGFAASIDAAASEVHEACQQHQNLGVDTTPLADLLRKLAEAAKSNDRQNMLICARSIAAYINNFSKESNGIVKKCSKEFVQDKIQRNSMALRNFGTQLKVLIAVKVASDVGDSDSDDQIVSVVRSMARSLAEALDGMDMAARLK